MKNGKYCHSRQADPIQRRARNHSSSPLSPLVGDFHVAELNQPHLELILTELEGLFHALRF